MTKLEGLSSLGCAAPGQLLRMCGSRISAPSYLKPIELWTLFVLAWGPSGPSSAQPFTLLSC